MNNDLTCIYCGETGLTLEYKTTDFVGDEFSLCHCASCNTYGLYPRPTNAQLSAAYNRDYYGQGDQKFNPAVEALRRSGRNRRSKMIAAHLNGKGRVLDIGCSDGVWLTELAGYGSFELEGTEIGEEAVRRANMNQGFKLHEGELLDLQLPAKAYDAITLNHVYEHLPNPRQVLNEITRLLKPNGILMIAIPNIDSWQAQWFKGAWLHLDPPRHLFFQSEKTLTGILSEKGFDAVKTIAHHTEFNPYGYQQSILNRISPQRELLYEALKGNEHLIAAHKSTILWHKLFVMATLPFFLVLSWLAAANKKSGTIEMYFTKRP